MIFESNLKGIKWTLTKKEIKGVRIFSMLAKLWVKKISCNIKFSL